MQTCRHKLHTKRKCTFSDAPAGKKQHFPKVFLRGWVKFPIGGTAREPETAMAQLLPEAGFGETPEPTVTVWMGRKSGKSQADVQNTAASFSVCKKAQPVERAECVPI